MKSLSKLLPASLLLLLLTACGSNLPKLSDANLDTGILAIPKGLESETKGPRLGGIATELQIRDPQGKTKAVRLKRLHGSQYHFLTGLTPGQYLILGYRPVSEHDSKIVVRISNSTLYEVQGSAYFEVKAGKVTVLPYVLFVKEETATGGGFQSWMNDIYFRHYKDKQVLIDLLNEKNQDKNWDIIWPQGTFR